MVPPCISYVTFNRLGLTVGNLSAILRSTDDFELYLIDNHSTDGTWDYLQSLNDPRIKEREQIEINHGKVYATNKNLTKRKPGQYFFIVDNDVLILTPDWISRYLNVFRTFPEVGLLGARTADGYLPGAVLKQKDGFSYFELVDNAANIEQNIIPGCCMCLRPELIDQIGYFCEENGFGEMELTYRVCNYTGFKAGFVNDVVIQMPQQIPCSQCAYAGLCPLINSGKTCFSIYDKLDKNDDYKKATRWKFDETLRDMRNGTRSVYCASLLDSISIEQHTYNMDWALDNFLFYLRNAN